MSRLDEAGLPRVVFECPPQLLDARRQRVVANDRVIPHGSEQFFFGDWSARMRQQNLQDRGSFGRKSDLSFARPEPRCLEVESIPIEANAPDHRPSSLPSTTIPEKSRSIPGTSGHGDPYPCVTTTGAEATKGAATVNGTMERHNLTVEAKHGALDNLLSALQDDVYGLALRMLRNHDDAEGATQEILIRVVTRLAQFDFRNIAEDASLR